jgi:hypothetical protein
MIICGFACLSTSEKEGVRASPMKLTSRNILLAFFNRNFNGNEKIIK